MMKTSPTSLKVRQIITQLKEGKLVPRPEFQRRLVWTPADKARFIETILKGYPFPEIYLANGPIDVDTGEGQQLLVDGQQRVTTIAAYFSGDASLGGTITPYSALEKEEKEHFLNYDVAARDLGSVTPDEIVEVFRRINSTNYSLKEIEINKAVYTGELMRLATHCAENEFFEIHGIFRPSDIKRMGDIRFTLQVIITMMAGYFNRDELFEDFLRDYNDYFYERDVIEARFQAALDYIDECGFSSKSRIWKRSDIFTALVQVDLALREGLAPNPGDAVKRIEDFFEKVDGLELGESSMAAAVYAKASLQASNDRINRLRRGVIFEAVLLGNDPEHTLVELGLF